MIDYNLVKPCSCGSKNILVGSSESRGLKFSSYSARIECSDCGKSFGSSSRNMDYKSMVDTKVLNDWNSQFEELQDSVNKCKCGEYPIMTEDIRQDEGYCDYYYKIHCSKCGQTMTSYNQRSNLVNKWNKLQKAK